MGNRWAAERLVARVTALDEARLESHDYRRAVLEELSATIGREAWVWPLADPITTVGISPMAQVPGTAELPVLITLKYATALNRWTNLPTVPARAVSLASATDGELSRSESWAGVLCRHSITDVLSIVFADRWGTWGWLDLWRGHEDGVFTAAEAEQLSSLAPAITTGLRHCSARQFQAGNHAAPPPHPQAVLVLAENLGIISQTGSAALWLELLQPGPRPHQGIPAEVLNVAAQLLAQERGVDAHPASSLVHVGSGVWARLSATRMNTPEDKAPAPIAVTIQDALPAERMAVFGRCFALSQRECQLLELAASGLDTAALARALGIGRYTVQDDFKSLFGKCTVQSRGALVAMAAGH
ncbi:LuxR family transcriptional regulator [Arthrobacter sp. AQ5-05]|uniref:helix-turn-helix transcriptional regulator n=1 Tax=Arthrobacter sp. AQ5-05 TaxID=2184581 RepID=UPI000DCDC6CA|nr:helix-turn-helix domain-containing protein [Arthrobacter sp. AQ5-05]RAX49675.1 LuxR family transcriptional regulator [Arthrobacter sp. AQ5-05]